MTNPVEILLVEDDPSDVELTLHALASGKVTNRIQTVRDGAEALDFLFCSGAFAHRNGGAPKVVLLDIDLPKVDGLEVLRRVKADSRTHRIPVVMLTSSREDSDLAKCYDLGVNSYIVKPVDFAKFTEAVRRLGIYWLLLNEPQRGN